MNGSDVRHPALDAITQCFAPIRHAQTALEASSSLTMMNFLPMVEDVKQSLTLMSSGKGHNPSIEHSWDSHFYLSPKKHKQNNWEKL